MTLIKETISQSKNHPDKIIREYYLAVTEIYSKDKDFADFISIIENERDDIDKYHLVNLLFRSTQNIVLSEYSETDITKLNKGNWKRIYTNILKNNKHRETHMSHLLKRSTQTTVYQRYAGPKALMNLFFKGEPINVLDIGCGLNIGLPGIEQDQKFKNIKDKTKSKKFSKWLGQKTNFRNGISIDISDPKKSYDWALSCSFYPSEMHEKKETEKVIKKLWRNTKTHFFQMDANLLSEVNKEKNIKFDVIIASTIFYQLTPEERERIFTEIHKILKPGGLLILNDFVYINKKLSWKTNWFKRKKSSYKTVVLFNRDTKLSRPYEFVTWDNGRCREVFEGNDYNSIINVSKKY
jgi:SAM-dependent methyltransferase